MKLKSFAAAAAFSLCATTGAYANDTRGLGAAYCSELVNLWNSGGTDTRDLLLSTLGQWTFGYFTGRNQELPAGSRKSLANLDNNRTAAVIVDVCSRNQNLFVIQVADALFQGLPYAGGTS